MAYFEGKSYSSEVDRQHFIFVELTLFKIISVRKK